MKGTVSRDVCFLFFPLKLLLAPNEQAKTVSRTFLFIRRYLPAHSEICDMLSYKRVFWRRNCRTRRPPLINTLKIWKNYSVLNLVLHRLTESNMLIFKIKKTTIILYNQQKERKNNSYENAHWGVLGNPLAKNNLFLY